MLDTSIDFKEQMVETRRTQILAGAAQVFAKKGFHKATTKEIAQAAGVAEGTIYNYFNNKRDLLVAMVEKLAVQTLSKLHLDNPPENPREFLKILLHDRFMYLENYGQVMAPLIAEIFTDPDLRQAVHDYVFKNVAGMVEQYFEHHVAIGKFRPINSLVITRALMGAMMLNSAFKLTHIDERYEEISSEDMIEELIDLLLKGILSEQS